MNNRDYWKRRSLNLEQLLYARADETVQHISRLYGLAQENIFQQIEKIFATYVKGGALNEEKAMQLLTVRETEEARAVLMEQYRKATGQAKRDLWARLSAPAYASRISRLQALRDCLYAQARTVGLEEVSYVRDRLSDTLEQSYYRTTFDIQQDVGAYYDFNRLSDNQIKAAIAADWSGKNWSDRIWDNNQIFADAVQDTVTVGIMAGLRYDEMRDNLLHVIGMDEDEGARYRAKRLVMTECAYVANQGHRMGYQAAGIEYYIFLATLDLRTSEICRSLDGKRFPVAEARAGTNLPPMHPHCRSTTMPDMTDAELRKIKRAARDPVTGKSVTVPGDMTYQEWYAKYVTGNSQAEANEKAVQNKAADRAEFARYQAVLGTNAPKTLAEFQQMKYTDGNGWGELRTAYQDETLKADIRAGKYNLTVNPEKQARHLLDSDGYIAGRSYLLISNSELQEIVNQRAGTGRIDHTRRNSGQIQEIIDCGTAVGVVVHSDGTEEITSLLKIHYSKTGVHAVPQKGEKTE